MSVHSSSGDSPDRDPHDLSPSTPNPEAPQAPPSATDARPSDLTQVEASVARAAEPAAPPEHRGSQAPESERPVDLADARETRPAADTSDAPTATPDPTAAATATANPEPGASATSATSATDAATGPTIAARAPDTDAADADATAPRAPVTAETSGDFSYPEPEAAPPGPPLPESFDELALPDALRRAIARLGWTKPSPVQALSFEPLISGRDVMVQSHTGSGKTGAFCVPWLASRFDPRPASETGVQLLVLLPTRELAKQVCDELRRLAVETPVDVLPVYGGTPMNPQLTSLRAGVHAVVGTPGRILDHIRRRSLDLSKVRTVILDECDEMLSMGFLEDIRAILDQVKGEHLTALFSATIPSDIERIAKRYMKDPAAIQLSGDQVAAAEIEHAYYMVNSAIKTRDLLDVIMVEDPSRAIVFCNTREETKLVASVLRREGFHAEELSSDLNQTQRERVMKLMREHKLRFLVATDVAARGIDISHVTHVINYSFPESAEVYVHRTGRTGRAGRTGIALSLINPREIGNFYYLKLQYASIHFGERTLPPAEQLAAERTEFKLDGISKRFPELVSPEWVLLARSLMADPRGERVIALLLERAMRQAPRPEPLLDLGDGEAASEVAPPLDAAPPSGPGETIERESRDLREHREPREYRERNDRGGPRDRDRGPRDRGERRFGDRPRDDRPAQDLAPSSERAPVADLPRESDATRPEGERSGRDRPRRDRFRDDRPRRDGEPGRGFRSREDAPRDGAHRNDAPRDNGFRNRDEQPRDNGFRNRDEQPRDNGFRNRDEQPRDNGFRNRDEQPRDNSFRNRDEQPRDNSVRSRDQEPRDNGFRNRDEQPRDHSFRNRDEQPRDNSFRNRDEQPRDNSFRNRDEQPRDNGFRNRDEQPRDNGSRNRDEQPRDSDRRRRRDRGPGDAVQLPLQATGEPAATAAVLDPPTPVLAPPPEAVLVASAPAEASATDLPRGPIPAPGHIRLDSRGRRGDRGRFVQRPRIADPTQPTVAAPVTLLVADAGESAPAEAVPSDSPESGDPGDAKRKRRRRRRRGRRDSEGAPELGAGETAGSEPVDALDADADSDAEVDGPDDDEPETAAESPAINPAQDAADSGPMGDARRKRRRRRRGGARMPEAPARAPEPPAQPPGEPVVVPRRMTQEEIIIDIDENELEVVQNEFGEIEDEFDEFALMDRRQAVIETLQEEVELEDVSRRDASLAAAPETDDETDETEDTDEPEVGASDLSEETAEPAAEPDAGEDGDARKKRRRRRRKKAAPVVVPELTAPPHKDFWEVWAAKYTFQDFEDDKFSPPNQVPEVDEEPPPPPVPADRPAPRASQPRSTPPRPPAPRSAPPPRPALSAVSSSSNAAAEADDAEFAKVCLNLGRSHGHKAATIRGLLRDRLGLEGRAIRDLTVRDADTLFRVHAGEIARIQEALAGVREGDLQLSVRPADDDRADELRAPPPDELPASPVTAAGTIALDPLEFAEAPRVGDDAGST